MHIRAPAHPHGLMHAQAHRSIMFFIASIFSSFFSPCVWFPFVSPHVPTQLAIDVWNVPEDAGADEYFGKVVVKIADWLESPQAAWHLLLPGQLQISATWTPYLDADRERLLKGSPVALTLAPEPRAAKAAPAVSTIPASSPKAAPAAATAMATGSNEPPAPSPPGASRSRALAALEAQAVEYEDDDDFEEEDDEEEKVYTTVVASSPVRKPAAAPSSAAPSAVAPSVSVVAAAARKKPPAGPAEFYEFTHKGGSGHGPKENQDAYFLAKIDEKNAVFGVLDGHGQDHGRVAAQAAAAACKAFLVEHFGRLRHEPEKVMHECFEAAHKAVFKAIKKEEGIFEDPETPGVLVMEMPEEEWPLGFDAADGGTTCSVGAYIDGRTLVYAAAGDSCALLGVPNTAAARGGSSATPEEEGAFVVTELVPEHSPTNPQDWSERLCKTGVHVVFDTGAEMFDDQPASLLPIFTKDGKGGWEIAEATLKKADDLGCGLKTERGDRASVVMTPENGRFSQMMLGVTRSVGDFYHQTYGVTWKPEVVVRDLHAECEQAGGASAACLIIASDGVWDHWDFGESMGALCDPAAEREGRPLTSKQRVLDFFEETRGKGEEAFGDGADNLTGIVAVFPNPGLNQSGGGAAAAGVPSEGGGGGSTLPGLPGRPPERDLDGDDSDSDFGV